MSELGSEDFIIMRLVGDDHPLAVEEGRGSRSGDSIITNGLVS